MAFSHNENKNIKFIWKHYRPRIAKVILRKENRAGGIRLSPTSGYTTKLWLLKQYSTGKKQNYRSIEQDRKSRDKPTQLWSTNLTKEAKIYNGEKTVPSISGAVKTGQLHVKE